MKYQELCIESDVVVREALKQLSNTAKGILFEIDTVGHLLGTLTDGDVRRHLLSGGNLESSVSVVANHNPRIASDIVSAKELYDARSYRAIPVVNERGEIVDIYIGDERIDEKVYPSIDMPVVINAGGKGTRLDPFTKVLPKPLIPVGDFPIIEHIIKEYQKYNCNNYHIIVNYKKEIMKAYFADSEKSYNIEWYDEEKPLGTGGGLSLLKNKLNSTFFFTNCDILLKSDYKEMLDFHKEHNNLITMICAYKTMIVPYGVIEMGKNGTINEMREKPEFSFLTNTGMYLVEPEVLKYIEDDVAVGFPDVVEKLRKMEKKVAAYPVKESEWYDMGQLPELERMRARLYEE